MAKKRLLEEILLSEEDLQEMTSKVVSSINKEEIDKVYEESMKDFQVDTIVKGTILNSVGDAVLVDIGYKSEGVVPKADFVRPEDMRPQQEIEVLLEAIEDETGYVALSKEKADKIRGWEKIIKCNKEGDPLKGRVMRKIKGGLLVDVGVPVFLPASQVDVHKIEDIGELVGREIEVKIIKIDEERMNVIVSRKKFLEETRAKQKAVILSKIKEGDVIRGVVKSFSEFGAFVDTGGLDGLIHLSDLSWGRVSHPSAVLRVGQQIECKVLKIDRVEERISLGLKQLQPNPWENIAKKYLVGSKIKGKAVNIMPYGVFVEIEPGIEGLVHVAELSWIKKINHPSEVVASGDEIEVTILKIDPERQEIALSLKQAQVNPWDTIELKYTPGAQVKGKVKSFSPFGAFIELEDGIEGLLHLSDISWTKRVTNPQDVLNKNDQLDLQVISLDKRRKRLTLGLKQLQQNPWETSIPQKYKLDSVVNGTITKIVSFGAFVELEKDLEGLIHTSRMEKKDQFQLAVGDKVEAKVIKLEPKEGKISLALVQILEKLQQQQPSEQPAQTVDAQPPSDPQPDRQPDPQTDQQS